MTVLPSVTQGEAFGMVLLESLACGTPVIASDLPGVRTVVTQGIDGCLVPPGDVMALSEAVQDLCDDPNQAAAMGAAGRAKVERYYSWESIGDRLEAIYRQMIAE